MGYLREGTLGVNEESKGPCKYEGCQQLGDSTHPPADCSASSIGHKAAGMPGSGAEKNKKMKTEWKIDYPILIDEDGRVGRAFVAKCTPTVYIIDARGLFAYHGAIDNASFGKPEGGILVNYVENALAEIKAGKPVSNAETKPCGCSVRYAKPKS